MKFLPSLVVVAACNAEGLVDPDGREIAPMVETAAFFAGGGVFVPDFVSTAATGVDVNDADEVIGTSYQDTGCGSTCLPPQDTVVWSGGQRLVLPTLPGRIGITVRAIDQSGRVVGFAGFPGTATNAAMWELVGGAYQITDMGVLPGTDRSDPVGIDETGRVVGWSGTSGLFGGAAFLWTEADGMVDLTSLGFPADQPRAISPGGMVATASSWYSLDDPASVVLVPPAPAGLLAGADSMAINDDGEQARFLVSTSAENLVYLHRLHADGTWNQIWPIGTGHLSSYGVGSIDATGTISATALSQGLIAFGPDGEAEPLMDLVAPTYGGGAVTGGGQMNETGDILAAMLIGASNRVVLLTPDEPCLTDCLVVDALKMKSTFVPEPGKPDQCTNKASTDVKVKVTVLDETGAPVQGASVTGVFLDDYWTNASVTQTTDAQGFAKFKKTLPACIGTTAFLVDDVTKAGQTFDRTTGTLVEAKIPN
jgi:probable HAF family extracellular repeat protein